MSPAPTTGVPLYRSLVVRLLVAAVMIVAVSVAAAAWLAVKTTTRAIEEERGQSLAADARIYDTLLGYAASHSGWDDVAPVLASLTEGTGRRITLTSPDRTWIAGAAGPLPAFPSAVIDPLNTEVELGTRDGTPAIDPRAVGPFRLSPVERDAQKDIAEARLSCLHRRGFAAVLTESPSGRSGVDVLPPSLEAKATFVCSAEALLEPTAGERAPLRELEATTNRCLHTLGLPSVGLNPDLTWFNGDADRIEEIRSCLDQARRVQLRPYVAPPVALFLGQLGPARTAVFDLSTGNTVRIAGTTSLVLLVAIVATVTLGVRMVSPLRALTTAAQQSGGPPAPVPVRRNDEIGRLAVAFNDLTERRNRSEEQRRVMVNDIAHELRSPLTNIRSWLRAAQDGLAPLDDDLLDLLLEEAGLLQHVVEDLRDLAAADAGTLVIDRTRCYVGDLLRQVADAHRGAAGQAHVAVTVDAADDPEADVDPARLRQIAGNLLSNAIRHTPAAGRVVVRAHVSNAWLIIEVADTGAGISPVDLPHVFDRFWRADRSRTRSTGGSGLGLAIARKLAQAHGGDISAISTLGTGSTFTVRIPVKA